MKKKNLKNYALVLCLAAALTSCDQSPDGEVSGKLQMRAPFGFVFAETPPGLPEGYLAEKQSFQVTPSEPDENFVRYEYTVTPETHLLYGVRAEGRYEHSKEACSQLKQRYIDDYSSLYQNLPETRISSQSNEWVIREQNARSTTLVCSKGKEIGAHMNSPFLYRLELIFQDKGLSMKGFNEWHARQKDLGTLGR